MAKKKKQQAADAQPPKPWCYYCNKKFSSEGVLIQHQKEKHFKCETCGKRLTSAKGLVSHSIKLHNKQVKEVPGAVEGRERLDDSAPEIYGMQGVPRELMSAEEQAYYLPEGAAPTPVVHPVPPGFLPVPLVPGVMPPPMVPMPPFPFPPAPFPAYPPVGQVMQDGQQQQQQQPPPPLPYPPYPYPPYPPAGIQYPPPAAPAPSADSYQHPYLPQQQQPQPQQPPPPPQQVNEQVTVSGS